VGSDVDADEETPVIVRRGGGVVNVEPRAT
jgi:hypothetical protein